MKNVEGINLVFTSVLNAATVVRSLLKIQSKQKPQLVRIYLYLIIIIIILFIYHLLFHFVEAKKLLLFAISKPFMGTTKQQKDDSSSCGGTPTSSHHSSSTPSSAGIISRSSLQIKTEDDLPSNSSGIADDQFMSQQAVIDDGMFTKTTTHEFAGKIDAPRTSSFGKMDAYNFKGALVREVEDAIAASNATSISQYFGGVDVVYKQSHSNNTVITPLFCPCRIVLEGFSDARIPTVIVCLVLEKGMTYAITAKYNTFNEFKQLNSRNRVIIHNEFTKNNPISMTQDFSDDEIELFSKALSDLLNLRLPVDVLQGSLLTCLSNYTVCHYYYYLFIYF